MKSKKTISILILISTALIFISCIKATRYDIWIDEFDNTITSEEQEVKINVETKKADYFYISNGGSTSYKIDGTDTIQIDEIIAAGEGVKSINWSWGEAIIAEDMKSITVKCSKNESGCTRNIVMFLLNDKHHYPNTYFELYQSGTDTAQ